MRYKNIALFAPAIIAISAMNGCKSYKLPKNISVYSSNGTVTYLSKEETDVYIILHAQCETEDMMFYDSVTCESGYPTDNPGLQINIEGDEIQKKNVSLSFLKKYCTGADLNVDIKLRSTNIVFNQFEYKIGLDPDDLPFEIVTNPFVFNAYSESGVFQIKKKKNLSGNMTELSFGSSGKDGKACLKFEPNNYNKKTWDDAETNKVFDINVTWGSGGTERKAYPITFMDQVLKLIKFKYNI